MRKAYPEIEASGARAVAVSVGHRYQAEALMADGMPFPLLTDPERNVVRALGVRRSLLGVLNPFGWLKYLGLMLRGRRPHRAAVRGILQMPGVAIISADGECLYVHRGRAEGDYPRLSSLLHRIRAASGSGPGESPG